jgi:hypothetical protein
LNLLHRAYRKTIPFFGPMQVCPAATIGQNGGGAEMP